MIRSTIFTMAALLMAGVAFTACSSEEEVTNVAPDGQTFSVCIPATKGIDADTRTLIWGEHSLGAEWSTSDKISVFKPNDNTIDANQLSPDRNGSSANLVGELAGTYEEGDVLKLVLGIEKRNNIIYPWLYYSGTFDSTGNYINQDGSKEYVEYFDYAYAFVEVTKVNGKNITTTPASFSPYQSFFKFTFTDGTDPVKASNVKIGCTKGKISRTYSVIDEKDDPIDEDFPLELYLKSPASVIYVALRVDERVTDDEIIFEVEDENGKIYKGTKASTATMPVNGKYYAGTVTLTYTGVQNTFKIEPAENYVLHPSGNYQIIGDVTISGSKEMGGQQIFFNTGVTVTFKGLSLTGGFNALIDANRGSDQTIILDGTNTLENVGFGVYKVKNLTFKGTGSLEGFKVGDQDKELFQNGTITYDIDGEPYTATLKYEDDLKFIDNGDGTCSIKKGE